MNKLLPRAAHNFSFFPSSLDVCFATYELQSEIYTHTLDTTTPGNSDKLRGKMRICRDDSYATKEHREGKEGFVTYELPSAIYIYPLYPNTNANFKTFTKKLEI